MTETTGPTPLGVGLLGSARVSLYALIEPSRTLPDLQVAMVGSSDPERAFRFAAAHDIPRWGSYDDVIDHPEIEAVYVALPTALHAAWSMKALARGKSVLCEKPLACNAEEARRGLEVARRSTGVYLEALHWFRHPVADRVRALVAANELGPIHHVETRFMIPRSRLREDDFRMDRARGGGVLLDAGYYGVSMLRLVLGEPTGVLCVSRSLVAPEVDGAIDVTLEFPHGATGRVIASNQIPGEELDVCARLVGEQGTAEITNPFLPDRGCRLTIAGRHGQRSEQLDSRSSYWFQARRLASDVRGGPADFDSLHQAIGNLAVVDTIYRAAGLRPRGEC